ncbi:MAG: peroxiredoxin [Phycisphaerae bacterium]|nr:peroxiredoxin [Phycisphaerae bacterium]
MTTIDPGGMAPDFSLRDQHGRSHRLRDYRGRAVVLYFYPEDDTPLCTSQACQFRDHHPDFTKVKAAVLGVSPDGVASHQDFVMKHDLPFTLLADEPGSRGVPSTCRAYGVWREKNMYGRAVVGMVRTTYLIGPDGRVVRRWDSVKTPGHARAVLAAVREMHAGQKSVVTRGRPSGAVTARAKKTGRPSGGHKGYSGVTPKARARVIRRGRSG